MRRFSMLVIPCLALLLLAVFAQCAEVYPPSVPWKQRVNQVLPAFGHRNWICVVDSAYPLQSREGIETIVVNDDMEDTLNYVLSQLKKQKHIAPIIYTDAELPFVPEKFAPGIDKYRSQLNKWLGVMPVKSMLHEDIIERLDTAAITFNVLLLKTNLKLPYTSVFIELDCGYWSGEGEAAMREALKAAMPPVPEVE